MSSPVNGLNSLRSCWRRLVASMLLICLAGPAFAACAGQNLIPELQKSDPEGVASMFDRANAVRNARGRLWTVEVPGADPSFLFGTFHSGEVLETVTPKVWRLLDAARISIFEVSLDQQAALEERMASDPGFAFDLDGPGVLSEMTEAQAEAFGQALGRRGVDLYAADRMQPWLLAALLGFPPCHLQAMSSGDKPMDEVLARHAVSLGIPVIGLESYDTALDSLNRVPKEQMLLALVGAPELLDQEEDVFRTNASLYAAGDVQAINEFGIYLTERFRPDLKVREINDAMMTELLDVRNRAWMPTLESELAKGGAFVAVGALHLPGAVGLVELLRAKGFTISRTAVD